MVFLSWKYFEIKGKRAVLSSPISPLSNPSISPSSRCQIPPKGNHFVQMVYTIVNTKQLPRGLKWRPGVIDLEREESFLPVKKAILIGYSVPVWIIQKADCTFNTHTHASESKKWKRQVFLHNSPQGKLKCIWRDSNISQFRLTAI